MNLSAQWIAFYTVLRKEIKRILRIWPQTLLPPVITMMLYFVIFWANGWLKSRANGWCQLYAVYRTRAYHDVGHYQQLL